MLSRGKKRLSCKSTLFLLFVLLLAVTISSTSLAAAEAPMTNKDILTSAMNTSLTNLVTTTDTAPMARKRNSTSSDLDAATNKRYGFLFVMVFLIAAFVVLPLMLLLAISIHKCLEQRRLLRALRLNEAHRAEQQQQQHAHHQDWDGLHPIENSFASVHEEEPPLPPTADEQLAGAEAEAEEGVTVGPPPPTLEGYTIENRVRPRQRPRHGTSRLEPTPHTVLTIHWDRLDPAQLPEAAPPPPSPREAARLAAAAARVNSPEFYGRAQYKDHRTSAPTSPVYINMNASLRGSPNWYQGRGTNSSTARSSGGSPHRSSTPDWSFAAVAAVGGAAIGGLPLSPVLRGRVAATASTASHYASSVEMNDYFDANYQQQQQQPNSSSHSKSQHVVSQQGPSFHQEHHPQQQYMLYEDEDDDMHNSDYSGGSMHPSIEEEPMYEVEDHDVDGYNNNNNQNHHHHDHQQRHTDKPQEQPIKNGSASTKANAVHEDDKNRKQAYSSEPSNEDGEHAQEEDAESGEGGIDERPGSPSHWARMDDQEVGEEDEKQHSHHPHNKNNNNNDYKKVDLFNYNAEEPHDNNDNNNKNNNNNNNNSSSSNRHVYAAQPPPEAKSAAEGKKGRVHRKKHKQDEEDGFSSTSDDFDPLM